MNDVRIQVLIPSYNNEITILSTLDSIWKQTYERDNIYVTVVDFASTDGTVEKLLSYDNFHLGIYQKEEQKNSRLRVSEAARVLDYVRPGGKFCFYVLLYPGDIMYPECLQKCAEAFVKNYDLNPISVICEADIMQSDGTVIKQKPIYPEDKIIDGVIDYNDYIKTDYKHQIFEMNLSFGRGRYKSNGEINEKRFWNKAARINLERNTIYIKEVLVCTQKVYYEDELEEILFRWESIISITRVYISKFGHIFNDDFERLAKSNLAEYALWRCWVLYQIQADCKNIEDCFFISRIIFSQIEESEIYPLLNRLIFERDITVINQISDYFTYT